MEAILKFNLPEDNSAHLIAIRGSEYFSCLWNLDQKLRSLLKHGHDYSSVETLAQDLRDYIHEFANFEGID